MVISRMDERMKVKEKIERMMGEDEIRMDERIKMMVIGMYMMGGRVGKGERREKRK